MLTDINVVESLSGAQHLIIAFINSSLVNALNNRQGQFLT